MPWRLPRPGEEDKRPRLGFVDPACGGAEPHVHLAGRPRSYSGPPRLGRIRPPDAKTCRFADAGRGQLWFDPLWGRIASDGRRLWRPAGTPETRGARFRAPLRCAYPQPRKERAKVRLQFRHRGTLAKPGRCGVNLRLRSGGPSMSALQFRQHRLRPTTGVGRRRKSPHELPRVDESLLATAGHPGLPPSTDRRPTRTPPRTRRRVGTPKG